MYAKIATLLEGNEFSKAKKAATYGDILQSKSGEIRGGEDKPRIHNLVMHTPCI